VLLRRLDRQPATEHAAGRSLGRRRPYLVPSVRDGRQGRNRMWLHEPRTGARGAHYQV
jgi:hypothetical protein